ncbi:MAG: sulfurtransferase-like selenium metabolism protein YedF [Firmicutes bacterium]|nr:sulfurtransferase-like selenium metabolism protein YedF [Bacillota bacterium]
MSSHEVNKLIVHRSLNVEGESCPYPEYYTLNALRDMDRGQVLEVIADCPQSFINIPESVVKAGHRIVQRVQDGTSMRFYIEVGGTP